jgi:hypothetical protein
MASNILLFFYKKNTKENKKNNKILPATSACCGAVVRNECRDHFSFHNIKRERERVMFPIPAQQKKKKMKIISKSALLYKVCIFVVQETLLLF